MRRRVSYEGSHGAPASQRLKQKLSLAPGLHLFSSNSFEEGVFASDEKTQEERIIHKTSRVTRNFFVTASTFGKVAKREPWVIRSDSFGHVVEERSIVDEPVETDDHGHGCSSLFFSDNGSKLGESATYGARVSNATVLLEAASQESEEGASSRTVRPGWSDLLRNSSVTGLDARDDLDRNTAVVESGAHSSLLECGNGLDHLSTEVSRSQGSDGLSLAPVEDLVSVIVPSDPQSEREFSDSEPPSIGNEDACGPSLTQSPSKLPHAFQPVPQEEDAFMYHGGAKYKDAAARTIQRYWRGWIQRKHFRAIKRRVVKLQSLVRRNLAARQYGQFLKAAILLQRNWRAFRIARLMERLRIERAAWEQQRISKAATMLQKHWRAAQCRHLMKYLKMERDISKRHRIRAAAITLEKHWRAFQARRLAYDLRKKRVAREQQRVDDAAVTLQKHWRAFQGRGLAKYLRIEKSVSEQRKLDNAATVLQKYWRVVLSKRLREMLKMQQLLREKHEMEKAAILVQKYWRGAQGRALSKRLKREVIVFERHRANNAAIVVQKHFRALKSRLLVKRLEMEQVEREHENVNNATIVVQKHWRALQSRRLVKHLRMEQALREQKELDNAAIVVQKHQRALQSRNLVKHLRMEKAVREQQKVINAAVVVQKHWRALQNRLLVKHLIIEQRRELQRVNNAAILVQKHWRGLQSQNLVKHLGMEKAGREQQKVINAAIIMQKHWRALQSRHLLKHLKREHIFREQQKVNHAAIVVQKHWRALQSRCLLKHLKREQLFREQQKVNHATIIVQKHCRALQSRRLLKHLKREHIFSEQQKVNHAAKILQKHWRALQSRRLLKHLKRERIFREQQKVNHAAIILQKHWRALQSRLLLKHLEMEQAVREQQKVNNAAIIMQKHWRAFQSRCLVRHLKMQEVSELRRVNSAAIVVQRHWRSLQGRQLSEKLKGEVAEREQAAVIIQALVKGNAVRRELKKWHSAAVFIQKVWKKNCQACVVPQAYTHAIKVQQGLDQGPKLAHCSQAPEHSYNELVKASTKTVDILPLNEMNLDPSDVSTYLSEEQSALDFCPSNFRDQHDLFVQSGDQTYGTLDSRGELSHGSIPSLQKGDGCYIEGGPCELSTTVEVPQEQTDEGFKGCYCGAVDQVDQVDQVDECLEVIGPPLTCSASPMSQQFLLKLVFPEAAEQLDTADEVMGSKPIESTTKVKLRKTLQQDKNRQSQTLKQNEKKLQQFAQVFLLHRHITLQQQRAQAAPPFPPAMALDCTFPSHTPSETRGSYCNGDLQKKVHSVINPVDVTGGVRSTDCELDCKAVNAGDQSSLRDRVGRNQNADISQQVRETPGADVVLDMVVLLRQLQECGASEVDFEGESSTCFPSGCGDIEEGKNVDLVRKQNSAAIKFAEAVGMNRLSLPDVNAVLVLLIAMVVYTRTFCQGVFFGTRQKYSRI